MVEIQTDLTLSHQYGNMANENFFMKIGTLKPCLSVCDLEAEEGDKNGNLTENDSASG